MGFCGSCLKFSCYILVAFLAVLAYFHMECVRENEEKAQVGEETKFTEFRPGDTEVETSMDFCKEGETMDLNIGGEYIVMQSAPCSLVKLLRFLSLINSDSDYVKMMEGKNEAHNLTIHDARKNSPGSFHETGFTLIQLQEETETKDWRTSAVWDEKADITKFHKQMEPHIRELYPEARRMVWTYNVVRGGDKFMDQPKAIVPHLDYHQNNTARIEFHKEWPVLAGSEADLLMGAKDDGEGKLGVLLGVWKPIHPASVCDYPLALMDVRTFQPHSMRINNLHINFGFFTFHNLNGAISYSPKQKWFYFPFQTTSEVLVFHQYSKGKWMANPHTSFLNTNCPADTQSRISVEMRLALYF